ncbi:hypothetical protein AB0I68_36585 [Streptomyces sp. NPDC050448]|uniref:hypothetical protein n=1 Tax=Streptomyces sp. NPDC050448 TaxID=3155404 RepID=UPI00342D4925
MTRSTSSPFSPDLTATWKLCYCEPPEEPGPDALPSCSWCRRDVRCERIAFVGHDAGASTVGLCDTCLLIGGLEHSSQYLDGGAFWASWPIVTGLAAEPHHEKGCAFCGRTAVEPRSWWPSPYPQDRAGVLLQLCDICPGLLELADAPDKERLRTRRLRTSCRVGMQDRLGQEAHLPEPSQPDRKTKTPRPVRLTEAHRQMPETIRSSGAMDAHAFARDARHSVPRRRLSWWENRIAHLFAHRLVTPLANPPGTHPLNTVRILEADERELEHRVYTWHVPGPVWDEERVREPVPPDGWPELNAQLTSLRPERDQQALDLRARTHTAR